MTEANKFIDRRYSTASELVQALIQLGCGSPENLFLDNQSLFRGQADSTWKLTPGVFREGALLPSTGFGIHLTAPLSLDHEAQLIAAELKLITSFLHYADQIGLSISSDSLHIRRLLRRTSKQVELLCDTQTGSVNLNRQSVLGAWPTDWVAQLLSLLQHFGLPTRLLDWTTQPLNAAYFAAEDAVRNSMSAGDLAIFGVSKHVFCDWLNADSPNEDVVPSGPSSGCYVLRVPTAGNANLIGQRGLFTVKVVSPTDRLEAVDFQELLSQRSALTRPVYRFLLPHKQARDLLFLLREYGVQACTIYPGWNGVARAVREDLILQWQGG